MVKREVVVKQHRVNVWCGDRENRYQSCQVDYTVALRVAGELIIKRRYDTAGIALESASELARETRANLSIDGSVYASAEYEKREHRLAN